MSLTVFARIVRYRIGVILSQIGDKTVTKSSIIIIRKLLLRRFVIVSHEVCAHRILVVTVLRVTR